MRGLPTEGEPGRKGLHLALHCVPQSLVPSACQGPARRPMATRGSVPHTPPFPRSPRALQPPELEGQPGTSPVGTAGPGRAPPHAAGGRAGIAIPQRPAGITLPRPSTSDPPRLRSAVPGVPPGEERSQAGRSRAAPPPPAPTRLVGVGGPEDVAGHGGVGVVGLRLDQVGEVGEVVAVVDEAGDVTYFVSSMN